MNVLEVSQLMTQSVNTVFDDEWDVMPAKRVRFIHPVGGVCKFSLSIQTSPYTGIFSSGTKTGIIRLSSYHGVSNGEGVFPGVGIKFLRTGRSSGNFVVSNTAEIAIPNYNFFSTSLKNRIPSAATFKGELVHMKLRQATMCTRSVGLSDLAR